jgi:hypothetical protein
MRDPGKGGRQKPVGRGSFSISGAVSAPGSQTGNDRIFRRFFAKNYEIRVFILFFVHPIVSPDKPVATGFFYVSIPQIRYSIKSFLSANCPLFT